MSRNPFQSILDDTGEHISIFRNGTKVIDVQCLFGDGSVVLYETSTPIEMGDVVHRTLDNGQKSTYLVTEVEYSAGYRNQVPSSYTLKVRNTQLPAPSASVQHTHNYHQVTAVHHGSGSISGVIQNVNSTIENIKQGIGSSTNINEDSKENLSKLFDQLATALKSVPPEHANDVEAITVTAQELMQKADQERPNPSMVRVSASGLVEAAKAVATAAPSVLSVAHQVAAFFGVVPPPVG